MRRHRRTMRGGTGAADYGAKLWGTPSQQITNAGSHMQAKPMPGAFEALNGKMAGGRRRRSHRRSGRKRTHRKRGGDLTALAVPAAGLLALHAYKKYRKTH